MSDLTVVTNNHTRPLKSLAELPEHVVLNDFEYLRDAWYGQTDEALTPRFFKYRGSWYDSHEFEVAGNDLKALGFDGVQAQSYFDAIAVRYFDRDGNHLDDTIVVAHIHW